MTTPVKSIFDYADEVVDDSKLTDNLHITVKPSPEAQAKRRNDLRMRVRKENK